MKIFNLYETEQIKTEDFGLKHYINFSARLITKTQGRHREKFGKGKVNIIERLIMYVNNSLALETFKMLMVVEVAVIPFGVPAAFDRKGHTNFIYGYQGSVHSVQGYVGKRFTHPAINHFGGWVFRGNYQFFEYCHSLGCNLEARLPTPAAKIIKFILNPIVFSVI